jgi:Flp pilus assembly protein TadG
VGEIAVRQPTPGRAPRRGGAAAVELAIVLSVLVPLFVLGLDLARVYRAHIILTDAARSGALYLSDPVAAQNSRYASYKEAALADTYDSGGDSLFSPALTTSNISATTTSTTATVTVTYDFPLVTSWGGGPTTVSIQRSVQVRIAPRLPDFS